MAQKLASVNSKTDWDSIRKEQMSVIMAKGIPSQYAETITDDDLVFLKHSVKNFASAQAYTWLESHLKEDQIQQLLRSMKVCDRFEGDQIYFVIQGELKSKTKSYKKGDVAQEQVEFIDQAQAFKISKELFDQFRNTEELTQLNVKHALIAKCIPQIRSLDLKQKQQTLTLFKANDKKFGSIVTVPGAGTANLFMLISGSALIYTLYRGFTIVGFLSKGALFNEQKVLFDRESEFGAIITSESQIFQLDSKDVCKLPDDCIQPIKAKFQAKQRLYSAFNSSLTNLSDEEFISQQRQYCSKQVLDYDKIIEIVKQNTVNDKIQSTDKQELIQKNTSLFEKIVGNNPMKNALTNMSDREKTLCLGTPRIISNKSAFLGLSQQQETSLFALRQLGTNIRKGVQTTNHVLPMAKEEINKAKNSLLEGEKVFATEILAKKSIGVPKIEDQKDNLQEKFKKKQDNLIEQYPIEETGIKLPSTEEIVIQKQEQPISAPKIQRQGSITTQTGREAEIAKKRMNLMKLGV